MESAGGRSISGDRFSVTYHITGPEDESFNRAGDICLEQTVELPASLIADGFIRSHVTGRIESFEKHSDGIFSAVISYAAETASAELTQFINVIFGNISIKPGIRLVRVELPEAMTRLFRGPRFGRNGIRESLGIQGRPILCTAVKPMGYSAEGLASLASQFALGGIDLIKDDHGLTDQSFAPFDERVSRCVEAIEKANRITGGNTKFIANITAPAREMERRARYARDTGAWGVMIAPGITGFDAMRGIACDMPLDLPIFSHPSFQGTYVMGRESGLSHYFLFGQMNRIAGADAVIYPSYGGRFSFTRGDCSEIVRGTGDFMGGINTSFPCPGGGISLDRIPELIDFHGNDAIFLIGAGLLSHGPDIIGNCRHFARVAAGG